jgi:hypothetical protein
MSTSSTRADVIALDVAVPDRARLQPQESELQQTTAMLKRISSSGTYEKSRGDGAFGSAATSNFMMVSPLLSAPFPDPALDV